MGLIGILLPGIPIFYWLLNSAFYTALGQHIDMSSTGKKEERYAEDKTAGNH